MEKNNLQIGWFFDKDFKFVMHIIVSSMTNS